MFRWTSRRRPAVALALAAGAFASTASADDWPQWRGPNRDGISHETGLLPEWPKGGPPLVWKVLDITQGYSSPTIVGDRIYLVGNKGIESESVFALSAKDGSTIWSQPIGKVGKPKQDPNYPAARSTVTVDGDRLYAFSSDGDLTCLEAATGKPVWQKNVMIEFHGTSGWWAYAESPLVDGDQVVVTPGGAEATFVALNKTTGDLLWKTPLAEGDKAGYSSIVVATIGEVKQFVQFPEKGLVGVEAASGKLLWRYPRTATGSAANIATPLVSGDLVYSAAQKTGGALVRINANGGAFTPEELYFQPNMPKGIGGYVVVDGYIYGTTNEALLCCDFKTGELKWSDRALGAASICYADGRLYLHGENGNVLLVEATPEKYNWLGKFTPPLQPNRGASKAWSYPVIADGKLYIYDNGTLWCYNVKAK